MTLVTITALIAATAAPAASEQHKAAGYYRANQPEVAAELLLEPNGRFRYALEYGAASETGEGDWKIDGDAIRLTSNPMPKAPRFVLVADEPAPAGELHMTLEDPGFSWGGPLEAMITVAGRAAPILVAADETGRVDLERLEPLTLQPLMPVYQAAEDPVNLSPDRGHRLRFRFESNDMGRVRFNGERLAREGDAVVLERYETRIRFERMK